MRNTADVMWRRPLTQFDCTGRMGGRNWQSLPALPKALVQLQLARQHGQFCCRYRRGNQL